MKRYPILLAALAAAPLAACASASSAGTDPGPAALDPAKVPIYYVGEKPQCGMRRLTEVQGGSEEALRWAAVQVKGNAVVGVRSRLMVIEESRGTYRRVISGPNTVRVFQGMAVRLDDRCNI